MTTLRTFGLIVLLATVVCAGCQKQVQTTFVNTTAEPLVLQVNGPGEGVGQLGTIPPLGELRTLIRVWSWSLPTTYTFTAGKEEGAFSIAYDSKSKISVTIPQDQPVSEPAWRHAEGSEKIGKTPVTYEP
jgi:hypothetical protein